MKKITYIILSFAAAAVLASCEKQIEVTPENDGHFVVTASIDQPTKATLSDGAGAFAFSNGDQIAICNEGSTIRTGSTTSTTNTATFTMDSYFDGGANGIAGFPASLVSAMTTSSVTFTLPTSYAYSEVCDGSSDKKKVVVPMMGTYTTGSSITLKHAGAVVRIRLTNLAAGTVTITFPTNITGTCTLTSVPETTDAGIKAANLSSAGKTVTITGVPEVTVGNYIYVTLPVPTGTAPQDILVTNEPSDASASRMVAIAGSGSGLNRAAGYKLSAQPAAIATPKFKSCDSPAAYVSFAPGNLMAYIDSYSAGTATASQWKFGGYFEFVGSGSGTGNYAFYKNKNTSCENKWVDLFEWQGASATTKKQGLANNESYSAAINGNVLSESLYAGCWTTSTGNPSVPDAGYIYIQNGGDYTWRPMTYAEGQYILFNRTTTDNLTDPAVVNPRFARASVNGVHGLLIFPDNLEWAVGMGAEPATSSINSVGEYDWNTNCYTSTNMINMANGGIIFLPTAGSYSSGSFSAKGCYWLRDGSDGNTPGETSGYQHARWYNFNEEKVMHGWANRYSALAVRLVRDVAPEP